MTPTNIPNTFVYACTHACVPIVSFLAPLCHLTGPGNTLNKRVSNNERNIIHSFYEKKTIAAILTKIFCILCTFSTLTIKFLASLNNEKSFFRIIEVTNDCLLQS